MLKTIFLSYRDNKYEKGNFFKMSATACFYRLSTICSYSILRYFCRLISNLREYNYVNYSDNP